MIYNRFIRRSVIFGRFSTHPPTEVMWNVSRPCWHSKISCWINGRWDHTPSPEGWSFLPLRWGNPMFCLLKHSDLDSLGLDSWSTLFVTGGCCPSKHASVTWREIEDIRWSYLMSIHCYLRFSPRCLVLRRFATAGPRSRGFFCGMKADLRIKNWEQLSFFNPLWIPFIVCT